VWRFYEFILQFIVYNLFHGLMDGVGPVCFQARLNGFFRELNVFSLCTVVSSVLYITSLVSVTFFDLPNAIDPVWQFYVTIAINLVFLVLLTTSVITNAVIRKKSNKYQTKVTTHIAVVVSTIFASFTLTRSFGGFSWIVATYNIVSLLITMIILFLMEW